MRKRLHRLFEALLEVVTIAILISLAVVVVLAVVFRKAGVSLPWYDEVAVIQLAWLTYYGAALAALKRSHLGFAGFVLSRSLITRKALFIFGEAVVFGFFAVIAWVGYKVLAIMAGESLISLPWVPLQFTQSVIPIGALLFMLAQALSLPEAWRRVCAGIDSEQAEIEELVKEVSRKTGAES